ncbi:hypothetical protein O7627_13545 [Solwaraspora sp. WMMD1047]|uniref:hypothetical protein n=1 Tax=Solwaraspora sp. WMMD1047 TaxID=3016102 RepID=UPI0024170A3A|nr:hypothetical protein [Solwaraspora sp. WMMD1047]MDG4830323.1 hypothetical protein [Solwaraspora sp. WMMD1047]
MPDSEPYTSSTSHLERHQRNTSPQWITILLAFAGLLVAILAWQFPRFADDQQPSTTPILDRSARSTQPPTSGRESIPSSGHPSATIFLDTLTVQTGGANLRELPRDLRGAPGYEHSIAIACPSNQNADKERSVSYLLRGRYREFATTVRPHFTAVSDSVVYAHALTAQRQRDGTLNWQTTGSQFGALMGRPASLTADVDDAEELMLRIECEYPEGMVILAGASLLLDDQ